MALLWTKVPWPPELFPLNSCIQPDDEDVQGHGDQRQWYPESDEDPEVIPYDDTSGLSVEYEEVHTEQRPCEAPRNIESGQECNDLDGCTVIYSIFRHFLHPFRQVYCSFG